MTDEFRHSRRLITPMAEETDEGFPPLSPTRRGLRNRANRAATILPVGPNAVAPRTLGALERLVRRLDHLVRVALCRQPLGHADADGHRNLIRATAAAAALALLRVLRPVGLVAQVHDVLLHRPAHSFEMWQAVLQVASGEHQGEFFATVTISATAAADLAQPARHEPQHLITDIVAMGIVECLEVIHVG